MTGFTSWSRYTMLTKKTFLIKIWAKKGKVLAHILEFPNFIQPNDYACGVAWVLSVLWYYGQEDFRECELEKLLKTTKKEWTETKNIIHFFQTKKFTVDARQMTIKDLETYITKGIPIIVSLQARSTKKTDYKNVRNEGHNVTVIGYNTKYLFFADPVTQRTCYLPKAEFIVRRHEQEGHTLYNNFGIAVYGKKPLYNQLLLEKIK